MEQVLVAKYSRFQEEVSSVVTSEIAQSCGKATVLAPDFVGNCVAGTVTLGFRKRLIILEHTILPVDHKEVIDRVKRKARGEAQAAGAGRWVHAIAVRT